MTTSMRFKCPACGFSVFNRRLNLCEACKAPLPISLGFNEKELALLEEEALRNAKIRRDLAREAEQIEAKKKRRREDGG